MSGEFNAIEHIKQKTNPLKGRLSEKLTHPTTLVGAGGTTAATGALTNNPEALNLGLVTMMAGSWDAIRDGRSVSKTLRKNRFYGGDREAAQKLDAKAYSTKTDIGVTRVDGDNTEPAHNSVIKTAYQLHEDPELVLGPTSETFFDSKIEENPEVQRIYADGERAIFDDRVDEFPSRINALNFLNHETGDVYGIEGLNYDVEEGLEVEEENMAFHAGQYNGQHQTGVTTGELEPGNYTEAELYDEVVGEVGGADLEPDFIVTQ